MISSLLLETLIGGLWISSPTVSIPNLISLNSYFSYFNHRFDRLIDYLFELKIIRNWWCFYVFDSFIFRRTIVVFRFFFCFSQFRFLFVCFGMKLIQEIVFLQFVCSELVLFGFNLYLNLVFRTLGSIIVTLICGFFFSNYFREQIFLFQSYMVLFIDQLLLKFI